MKALALATTSHITVLFAAAVVSTRLKPTLERITMSKLSIYALDKAAAAVAATSKGVDKAHAASVSVINRLIDRIASVYASRAAAINAAPYNEAAKLFDQVDVLLAIFIEEDERRREAYKKESSALLDKAQACTSKAVLGKANAAAIALHKTRAELLALKK